MKLLIANTQMVLPDGELLTGDLLVVHGKI